ncbi:MAG: prolipoprotein diacylglyceryl transferase [Acidimicrobiales bacterium]
MTVLVPGGVRPADLPSPGSNSLDIGPLSLNAYGLFIALGVLAAVWLFGRRLEARGIARRDTAGQIAVWAVIAGVIGARLYHVVTDWHRFDDDLADIPKIWEGGLGIPGGLLAGVPVGMWAARRHAIGFADAATCAAPCLPLAQAIGRWGNWFNQELFGRPTDLPWALEIDDEHMPAEYTSGTTFHPAFLYESLWNLALFGVLLLIDRRRELPRGSLMAIYVAGYGIGRLWVEGLRIDPAHEWAGLRLNQWVALAAIIAGTAYAVWALRRDGATRRVLPEPSAPGSPP